MELQLGAKERHKNIEILISFARSVIKDLIRKGVAPYVYDEENVEKTEIFVGTEYPVYAQNVKLIVLVRDMAPTYADPLIASSYDSGRTLSTLQHAKLHVEYTTFMFMVYARSRYDSKYYATYISNYLAYYEEQLRGKLSIQDVMRRSISQTVPSYITSYGERFVSMVTVTLTKLETWDMTTESTSPDVYTVEKEKIYSVHDNQKDGKLDVAQTE